MGDGLLLKTRNETQTDRFMRATLFGEEECIVSKVERLNESKGTIYAHDLTELSEEEIVRWLREFGVKSAKRITRRAGPRTENTPLLILTFDQPKCPTKLQLDYVLYEVRTYVPNPMICLNCGQYGHIAVKCQAKTLCLTCGSEKHEGECTARCLHCSSAHACLARECPKWKKEKEICEIKVQQDVSYAHARRIHEAKQPRTNVPTYATVANPTLTPTHEQDRALKERVRVLEEKVDKVLTMLTTLISEKGKQTMATESSEPPVTPDPDRPIPDTQSICDTQEQTRAELVPQAEQREENETFMEGETDAHVDSEEEMSQEVGGWKTAKGKQKDRGRGRGRGGEGPGRASSPTPGPSNMSTGVESQRGRGWGKRMPSLTRMKDPGKPDHST